MSRRHFGIENELSTGFFKRSVNVRQDKTRQDKGLRPKGVGGNERSRVSVIIMVCALELAPEEDVLLVLSCQAFARFLLVDLELVLWSMRVVAS